MVELTSFDYYNGTLSLIQVVIQFIIGFALIYKYLEYRNKQLLYMGLTMIALTSVWLTHAIAFVLVLITGAGLSTEVFFIMAYPLTAVAIVLWMVVMSKLLFKEKKKLIIIIYVIYAILFEILFFILLFDDTMHIGVLENPIEPDTSRFILIHLVVILITALVTGFLFFRESKKSQDPEIKLKGKLFFVGVILFVTGSIVDALNTILTILLIIRVILMVSAFFIYMGFLIPDWMKNLLLKEK